jgi:hypothetical protein
MKWRPANLHQVLLFRFPTLGACFDNLHHLHSMAQRIHQTPENLCLDDNTYNR